MASYKSRVFAIPSTSIAIGAAYAPINPLGLPYACYMLRITNASNAIITISYDGVTDHDWVLTANTEQLWIDDMTLYAKGLIVYAKGAGAGSVYVSGYYKVPVSNA